MKTNEYNYKHFGLKYYAFEGFFEGPRIGTPAPDFTATTLDKKTMRLSDLRGKIVVLESGSLTCPLTTGATGDMQELVRKYPDIVFLLLYVREAHPGNKRPAQISFEDKISCAKRFQEEEHDNRIIIVDDLEGGIHKQYGLVPTFVYVIDPNGHIAWRNMLNVPNRLDEVLTVLRENPKTQFSEERTLLDFDIKHFGFRSLKTAGWRAIIDVIIELISHPRVAFMRRRLIRKLAADSGKNKNVAQNTSMS